MSTALEQASTVPVSLWQRIFRVLQIGVTLALIAWLVRQTNWVNVGALLRNIQPVFVAVAFISLLACHWINIARWRYLLDRPDIRFNHLLPLYAIGLFANNFLPTGIGGDGVRVALLRRYVPLGRALFSVAADRGIGLVAVSAVVLAGLWAGVPASFHGRWQEWAAQGSLRLVLLASLALLALVAALVWRSPHMRTWLMRRTAAWQLPQWNMGEWVRRIAVAYGISVGAHLCIVGATWAMLAALHIDVPLAASLWLVIISSLSMLAPVTVNGMGLVESVYVLVLSSYGVAPSAGLGVALIIRLIALLISLSGGVWMLDKRSREREAVVE